MSCDKSMFVCTLCSHFAGRGFSDVLCHIGTTHRYDPGLSIRCGIRACPKVYTNFESFRSHVYRKHRDELFNQDTGSVDSDSTKSTHFQDCLSLGFSETEEEASVGLCPVTDSRDPPSLQRNVAKFLLKTKEECKLTQAAMDNILSSVKGLWGQRMDDLKQKLVEFLPDSIEESIFGVSL